MADHIDMHTDIFRSDPNIISLFGHTHQTRWGKFSEWCSDLYWHFRELSKVFKKDPPNRPGFLSTLASHTKEHENWYDDPLEVSDD